MIMLKDEFTYYLDNQMELAKKHEGKVLVIKDKKVVGIYSSELEALNNPRVNTNWAVF